MAHALVSFALEQLATVIQLEITHELTSVVGAQQVVNKLITTLKDIQAVLDDAEQRRITDQSVKVWFDEFKEIAYEMGDILDEWSTQILRSSQLDGVAVFEMLKEKVNSCLTSLIHCFDKVSLHDDIESRMKDIMEKLDWSETVKNKLNLIKSNDYEKQLEPLKTSSLIDVLDVCRRDRDHVLDKETILGKLLGGSGQQHMANPQYPSIITIVGMGGVGKTSLAQLVFNDEKVKTKFIKTMWVHVSDPFNLKKVLITIIREADVNDRLVPDWLEENALHHLLSNITRDRQFLLVLDDVWTADKTKWDQLMLSLQSVSQGSRILVTTRNEKFALMIDSNYIHYLGLLSESDCWALLSRIAFVGREKQECEMLEEIGIKIAKKCKGLPLAAKILGGLLHFKKTEKDWQNILESEIWQLEDSKSDVIKSALQLSYHHLASPLKGCLTYCVMFPKDHIIRKDELIRLWIAQGLISSNETNEKWEKIGEEYFNNLLMHSFFRDVVKDDDGIIKSCKMHDQVHDFAQFLTNEECFIVEDNDVTQLSYYSTKARHLTLIKGRDDGTEPSSFLASVYKTKNLRTLKIMMEGWRGVQDFPPDLFQHLKCLRVLNLYHIDLQNLPSEIESLIHLRYLDLGWNNNLRGLPESISNLYNLQTFKVDHCLQVYELPKKMNRMINLRHIVSRSTPLGYLPQGIGKLEYVQTLDQFIVGGPRGGCDIGELKCLNLIEGSINIRGLQTIANSEDAYEAELKKKQHVHTLILNFTSRFMGPELDHSPRRDVRDLSETSILGEKMDGVLQGLEPHPNVKRLYIYYYPGLKFPSWMNGSSLLCNLLHLELRDCMNCTELPGLGQLSSLEVLKISKLKMLRNIGLEFCSITDGRFTNGAAFPELKELHIKDMESLEELHGLGHLPSLEVIKISLLNKLRNIGLEFYSITGGSFTDGATFPKLKELRVEYMESLEEWDLREHPDCRSLTETLKISHMPCLNTLWLRGCPNLKSLPFHLPDTLHELEIEDCPELTWPTVTVFGLCHKLSIAGEAGVFSRSLAVFLNVKYLEIKYLPNSILPDCLSQLNKLESLTFGFCDSLMFVPIELEHLLMLQELKIYGCPHLEPRCRKDSGEDWNVISHITNIFIDFERIE